MPGSRNDAVLGLANRTSQPVKIIVVTGGIRLERPHLPEMLSPLLSKDCNTEPRLGSRLQARTSAIITTSATPRELLARVQRASSPPRAGARSLFLGCPERRALRPQVAVFTASAPQGDDWLHEIKYDGYRTMCFGDR